MQAKPARGRNKFAPRKRPRITYQLSTEGFEYRHGVSFSQEAGRFHVINSITRSREQFTDRPSAYRRFERLAEINKNLGVA